MPLDRKAKEALTFLGAHLIYGLAAGAAFGIGAQLKQYRKRRPKKKTPPR